MTWKPDYIADSDLKSYVRIDDGVDDAEIAFAITAASRAVDNTTGRQFGQLTSASKRFYTAEFDLSRNRWVVVIDDLMTKSGLAIDYDEDDDQTYSAAIDDFRLQPANAVAEGQPWTMIVVHPDSSNQPGRVEDGVRVTAKFGWTAIPGAVRQATLMQASRFLARRDSPYGVAGSPDLGAETRLLARLDPDVAVVVTPYRRWWGAVS